jgi:CheY-like chemotaxis protein
MTLSGLRVLLAEDNPTNQLVAAQMLESLGASVLLAADGAEALDIVAREPFDVMLVDIEMPRVSGIEVIRTVRGSSGPIADVPLIALTAYVMREHRAAIAAAGADGVIAKPILSIEQFGADIRRFMGRRSDVTVAANGDAESANGVAPSVIDRNIYDTLADAIGPAAMRELLGKVDSDMRAARARLVQALDPIDIGKVRSVTHILISVAGAVGALPVQEGARRMNAAGHRNDAAAIERDMQGLLGEIDRMLEHLRKPIGG